MVEALYAFLLVPVVLYIVFSVMEIWLTYQLSRRKPNRTLLFIQASTEITHTLLVFAYAQFMVTFSPLLVDIGASLWWPVALLMASILVRGSLYMLLFYKAKPRQFEYMALLVTYLAGVIALVWFLSIVVPAVVTRGFVPDTSHMPIVLAVGVPALALGIIPLIAVYRNAFMKLRG